MLDTCAAPGSKTAQILEMLHHGLTAIPTGMSGTLLSLDASWHHTAALALLLRLQQITQLTPAAMGAPSRNLHPCKQRRPLVTTAEVAT